MAYSTKSDMLKRVKADRLNAMAQNNDANITQAIVDADDEINSYLMNVVDTVPLEAPPAMVIKCSVIIALKNLSISNQFQETPQWLRDEYNDCIKYLDNVAKGNANLKTAADVEQKTVIDFDEPQVIFTRNSW